MDENNKDNLSKIRLVKVDEKISLNSKIKTSTFSLLKKLLNIFCFLGNIFSSLKNKINSCSSNCSIIIQFVISLIPISIIMIILIFMIHIYFYSDLYVFNFSKVFKDEFLDLYITEIDDLKSELTPIIAKETQIDIENQLFFQVYFTELYLSGIMNPWKNFFPSFSDNPGSTSLFSKLNNFKNTDANFEIPLDRAKANIEGRYYDRFGKFNKIYYYMFPHIWYESFRSNNYINQSFFMGHEIYSYHYFLFRFPKELNKTRLYNNFISTDYFKTPLISIDFQVNYEGLKDSDGYSKNWIYSKLLDFVSIIENIYEDYITITNISFIHLNEESNGNINKTFITCAEQSIRGYKTNYIFYITFFGIKAI